MSAVEGRVVHRWGTSAYFGTEMVNGQPRQDVSRVYPLTAEFVSKYSRELSGALTNGDLKERTHEEWQAYVAAEEAVVKAAVAAKEADDKAKREAKEKAEAAAKAEAEKAAASGADEQSGDPPHVPSAEGQLAADASASVSDDSPSAKSKKGTPSR